MTPRIDQYHGFMGPPVLFSQIGLFLAGHDPRSYDSSGTTTARRVVGCNHRARPAASLFPEYRNSRTPRDVRERLISEPCEADTGLSRRSRPVGGVPPSIGVPGLVFDAVSLPEA
jgi:hypothetical protein